ncbi:MAG: molybdopterin molybdotransferase MoeA [FCB group bacterium]|jgi:molybdopterin molybdotransferase|nr:molybdopterin molybdotransferase MoeA [FCB group bacterium]
MEEYITVERADSILEAAVAPYPEEDVPLSQAHGRVLRTAVYADRPYPPFNRVTMDGIAFRLGSFETGRRRFPIETTVRAGEMPLPLRDPDACIEVMTGAPLPKGCDCVVPVERLIKREAEAEVTEGTEARHMQNIHPQGSDFRAGDLLLSGGLRLSAPAIAVAASVGCATLRVSRLPRIAVIATGDELADVEESPIAPHRIRRSNDYAIAAALRTRGYAHVDTHWARDDEAALRDLVDALVDCSDAVVLTGGVSMGAFDYVPRVLHAVGVKALFHKVKQRPGKPILFGPGMRGQAVFALPGNPASALVCLYRYVLPSLDRASGARPATDEWVILERDYDSRTDLTCFLPVRAAVDRSGRLMAEPRPGNTSGDFATLAATDGFVELAAEQQKYPAGHTARLIRWSV